MAMKPRKKQVRRMRGGGMAKKPIGMRAGGMAKKKSGYKSGGMVDMRTTGLFRK